MKQLVLMLLLSLFAISACAGTLINNNGLTHFGNLERSGGVDGNRGRVFDEDAATGAYREATTGYVGISLAAPTEIESLEFISQANGFDASGQTSQIAIRAYCKTTPGAPSNDSDGTLIGTLNFTDVNSATTKLVTSDIRSLQCRHVWGKLTTGVWSVLTELRVYAPDALVVPEVIQTTVPTVFRKSCNERAKLNYSEVEFRCFRQPFKLNEPRAVLIDLHVGLSHTDRSNNGDAAYGGVVGIGVRVIHRWAATPGALSSAPWQEDGNMIATGNIYNYTQHYIHLPVSGCWNLPAGVNEISIFASNHTDALPLNDTTHLGIVTILAEGASPPYAGRNLLRVQVLPVGATCNGG